MLIRVLTAFTLALALALLGGPGVGWGAQAFVQKKICAHSGALAASFYECVFDSSVTSGNAIFAVSIATVGTVTAITFTDDKSGTYATYQSYFDTPVATTNGALGVGIAGTTGTTTVRATFTNTVQPTFYALAIYEYSGVNTSTPVDVSVKNTQTTPTTTTDAVTSTALVTTGDAETLVGCAFTVQGTTNQSGGTGFTNIVTNTAGTAIHGACEDFAQSVAGSKALTFTAADANNDVMIFGVALKNPAAATAVPQQSFPFGILFQ